MVYMRYKDMMTTSSVSKPAQNTSIKSQSLYAKTNTYDDVPVLIGSQASLPLFEVG